MYSDLELKGSGRGLKSTFGGHSKEDVPSLMLVASFICLADCKFISKCCRRFLDYPHLDLNFLSISSISFLQIICHKTVHVLANPVKDSRCVLLFLVFLILFFSF